MEEQLTARRAQAESSFNALVQQKEQKQRELNDIDAELNRLQGEYRLVDDLLNQPPAAPSDVSPEANVIDVTPKKGKK